MKTPPSSLFSASAQQLLVIRYNLIWHLHTLSEQHTEILTELWPAQIFICYKVQPEKTAQQKLRGKPTKPALLEPGDLYDVTISAVSLFTELSGETQQTQYFY